ncbi:MAG: spore germination protein [Clostridia bacterium]|nr:spore germination protein [Clostridia bacterium]
MKHLSTVYEENLSYFKTRLRPGENFDVICREIKVAGEDAAFFYIDGFTKDDTMQKLLQYFIGMKSIGKDPTPAAAFAAVLPYVEVDVVTDVEQMITLILSGASVMLARSFGSEAVVIDSRTYPARQTEEPDDDRVMQGAHDGFVETLIFNTALIRRRIRDPRLSMHYVNLGGSSRTDVVLCYLDGRADPKYVAWLEGKLRSVHPDSLTLGMQSLAECLIPRRWFNPFPKARYLGRPDAAAAELCEGRVLLLCDTSPQVMVLPVSIFDFMQETDDFYLPPVTGCYMRLLRHGIMLLALFFIPTWYLLLDYAAYLPAWAQVLVPKNAGALPLLLQIYLAELAVDGLKLASMNTPNILTNSLSVIGGLILGEFAVSIGWLSSDVIFYIALVAIAGFSQQNHELGYAFKFMRMIWLALAALFGVWGYFAFLPVLPILLLTNRTINGGQSYLYPLIPFNGKALVRLFLRLPKRDVSRDDYPKTYRQK